MQEIQVWPLGLEDCLEKGMATHSSILAWRIPWTEEPGGVQTMGLQRVWVINSLNYRNPLRHHQSTPWLQAWSESTHLALTQHFSNIALMMLTILKIWVTYKEFLFMKVISRMCWSRRAQTLWNWLWRLTQLYMEWLTFLVWKCPRCQYFSVWWSQLARTPVKFSRILQTGV